MDLVNFYSSYGSYHNNKINKAIHLVCIPLILISAIQITNHYSFEIQLECCKLNLGLVVLAILTVVYMTVDFVSGILASAFYIAVTLYLNNNHQTHSNHLMIATTFQVTCWILQFIGHGVFEKRAPALLDNILQIFVAPDFVFLEFLFFFGYKPQVHIACQNKIDENIKQFRKSKKQI